MSKQKRIGWWLAVPVVVALTVGCGLNRNGNDGAAPASSGTGPATASSSAAQAGPSTKASDGAFDICGLIDPKAIGEVLAVSADLRSKMWCDRRPPKKDSVKTSYYSLYNAHVDTVATLAVAFGRGVGGQEEQVAKDFAAKNRALKVTPVPGIGDAAYYYEPAGGQLKYNFVASKRMGNDSVAVLLSASPQDPQKLLPTLQNALNQINQFVA